MDDEKYLLRSEWKDWIATHEANLRKLVFRGVGALISTALAITAILVTLKLNGDDYDAGVRKDQDRAIAEIRDLLHQQQESNAGSAVLLRAHLEEAQERYRTVRGDISAESKRAAEARASLLESMREHRSRPGH